jgi:hypothetical protein
MECPVCNTFCSNKFVLKRHWERHPSCKQDIDINQSFTCEKCSKNFKSELGYKNHIENTCSVVKLQKAEDPYKAKIDELIEIIAKKDAEIAFLKNKLEKKSNTDKYTSLRDINELKNTEFITQKLKDMIHIDHVISSQGMLIRSVIVPLLRDYIIVKDPSRSRIIYKDGEKLVKKGDIDSIMVLIRGPIASRLSDIEFIKKRDCYKKNSLEFKIFYAHRRFRYPVMKGLYEKTINIDPKGIDI